MTYDTISDKETMQPGAEGTLLAGRYRIVRQLGQGGMGSVWLAEDTQLDNKQFAIKMLPSVLVSNKRAYRQLKDEALVAMKLTHPNIVTLRAFEENNGNPFLVMDYIDGETLDDYLAEHTGTTDVSSVGHGDTGTTGVPPVVNAPAARSTSRTGGSPVLSGLPESDVLRLLRPIAAALDYAHGEGVVHRDVKPANVMIRKDGHPFILDFGIAREIQETMTRVTGKLSSGTLLYMSPEQLNGDMPKPAQDIYSFAAMAYECLKGEPPFVRGAIEDQIKNKEPSPPSPDIAISGLVMQGLAKKPEDRPKTCVAVLEGNVPRGGAHPPLEGIIDPRGGEHAERSECRGAQGNGAGRAEHVECAYGGVGGNSSGRKGRKTREGSKGGSCGKIVGVFLILLFAMAGGWWLMNKSDISHVPMDNAPSSVSNVQSGSTSGVNVEGVGGQCVITDLQRQVSIFSGKRIPADVIVEMLGLHVGADLALIDFKKKREDLLKRIPTLRNVSISRKSPDRVEIVAEERVPIAKLGVRGRKGLTGRVVDSEGMVFPCMRGIQLLPTIVELPPSWTAIGQQLKGRSLAALRLVEMCQEPEFSDLAVSEIDIANPDYLLVTLGESHVQAKIAWAGMDSPNDNRSDDLKGRLTKLQSAIHTNTTGGVKLWNATLIKHSKVQLWECGPYWADRNIGAENPWDYGYYFWWGDTVGYKRVNDAWVASDGSSSNFAFKEKNTPVYGIRVSELKREGWITADNVLVPKHDAARVQWGGEWRMPTKEEMDDLCKKCDWKWTTMNGVSGYIVRGRGGYASASIFLPATGYGYGTSLSDAGSYGSYWSSVPQWPSDPRSDGISAWRLYFDSNDHYTYNYGIRYLGQSVRPVQGFTK